MGEKEPPPLPPATPLGPDRRGWYDPYFIVGTTLGVVMLVLVLGLVCLALALAAILYFKGR